MQLAKFYLMWQQHNIIGRNPKQIVKRDKIMRAKISAMIALMIISLTACASTSPIAPETAQAITAEAWQANYHVVWEIDWAAMPVGGAVTVEAWQVGEQYRYEILESTAPALVGETLIFDGQQGWHYQRFDPDSLTSATPPHLAPMSEAVNIIDTLLGQPARRAQMQQVRLGDELTRHITLIFDPETSLSVWIAEETNLPHRLRFRRNDAPVTLMARSIEPLTMPPAGLFKPTVGSR